MRVLIDIGATEQRLVDIASLRGRIGDQSHGERSVTIGALSTACVSRPG